MAPAVILSLLSWFVAKYLCFHHQIIEDIKIFTGRKSSTEQK